MKKVLCIAVFAALMSAGALTCKASVILQDTHSGGAYYACDYMTQYLGHAVYSVEVYWLIDGVGKVPVSSGVLFYDPKNHVIQMTAFETNLLDARGMQGVWTGSSATMYYCTAYGYYDNCTLALVSN